MEKEIFLATRNGPVPVIAEIVGDFGIHKSLSIDAYVITHLPSGLNFGGVFFEHKAWAISCAEQLQLLRNDWAVIEDDDLTEDLKAKALETLKEFGASRLYMGRSCHLSDQSRINGYEQI